MPIQHDGHYLITPPVGSCIVQNPVHVLGADPHVQKVFRCACKLERHSLWILSGIDVFRVSNAQVEDVG